MRNSLGARVLLVIGFLAASVAYGGWVALHTVLDTSATRDVAQKVVATPKVSHGLADQLQPEVDRELRDAHASAQVRRAVDDAVRDPRVAAAFADAVAQVQHAALTNAAGTVTIDATSLTAAVHDAFARTDPALAEQLAQEPPLSATIDANKVPHLQSVHDWAQEALVFGMLAALLLIGASLALDHSRKAVARAGRRVSYLSITTVVSFGLLPHLLGTSGTSGVARVALDAYASRVLPSGITLLIAGVMVVLASTFMQTAAAAAAARAEAQYAEAPSFLPGRPLAPPRVNPAAPAAPHRINETVL